MQFVNLLCDGDGIDLQGPMRTATSPITLEKVVEYARMTSGVKAKIYAKAVDEYANGMGCYDETRENNIGKVFVKFELLANVVKSWFNGNPVLKFPRNIFSPNPVEVVAIRMFTQPIEEAIYYDRITFKKLPTDQKHVPFQQMIDLFGTDQLYVVCLDDTSRDANSCSHDFKLFMRIMRKFNLLGRFLRYSLTKKGFALTAYSYFVSGKWQSLLSGTPFTSLMNYWTSMFIMYYIFVIEYAIPTSSVGFLAEGDDSAAFMPIDIGLKLAQSGLLQDDRIKALGLKLRKDLKVESHGPLNMNTGHPIVGGVVVELDGKLHYFPDLKRFLLKSCWVTDYNIISPKVYRGKAQAKAYALLDRFSGIPVYYAYALKIADFHGASPKWLTKEERFSINNNIGCFPPTIDSRYAFEKAFGISIADQYKAELIIQHSYQYGNLNDNPEWVIIFKKYL